ncbi:MAG: hypothetical protein WAN65_12105 [Candidatus Sulfotelmatobacter sp.]
MIFLCALFVGGFILPAIIMLSLVHELRLGTFYLALFDNKANDQVITWLVLIGPYVLVQAGRSVIWAYRTLKENANG